MTLRLKLVIMDFNIYDDRLTFEYLMDITSCIMAIISLVVYLQYTFCIHTYISVNVYNKLLCSAHWCVSSWGGGD